MKKSTMALAVAMAAAAASLVAGASAQTRGVTPTEVLFGMHTDLSGVAATYGV
jgi:branched-chain amino acid transport system substrate-binding protein